MGTVTFMGLQLSNPAVIQSLLTPVVQALVSNMTNTKTQLGTATTLPNLVGATGTAQQSRSQLALQALQQVITGVAQAQLTASTGGAQLQATKAQLDATVASATASGYQVLPSGQVTPGAAQRAYCSATWSHGGAKLWHGVYVPTAAQYTAQISATTATASTLDAQLTAALVKLVTDFLTSLFQKQSDASTTSLPGTVPGLEPELSDTTPTPLPPTGGSVGLGPAPLPVGAAGGLSTAELTGATALAGAGGAGAPIGGAGGLGGGPAGVGLSGASVANAAVAMQGGAAGVGVAGISTVGAAAAGAGRAGGGAAMMGAGGGHAGANGADGEHEAASWLVEDGKPWTPGDAPDGVIA